MGCFSSKGMKIQGTNQVDLDELHHRIADLEKRQADGDTIDQRLSRLEKQADLNSDGVVTRQEMETFMAMQLQRRENDLLKLNEEKKRLQEAYDRLYKEHLDVLEQINKGASFTPVSKISDKAIETFVDTLINDPEINIYGLPDRLEKAMYRNTLKMVMHSLEKVFSNVGVELIGHRLRVNMEPLGQGNSSND